MGKTEGLQRGACLLPTDFQYQEDTNKTLGRQTANWPRRQTVYGGMLAARKQSLDQLVPRDHLLRLIDTHLRFDFIRRRPKVSTASTTAAQPSTGGAVQDAVHRLPVRGALGALVVREIEVTVAYRWFLGLRLTDKVPDASTLSQNRRRRFAGTGIEQAIFDTIVERRSNTG